MLKVEPTMSIEHTPLHLHRVRWLMLSLLLSASVTRSAEAQVDPAPAVQADPAAAPPADPDPDPDPDPAPDPDPDPDPAPAPALALALPADPAVAPGPTVAQAAAAQPAPAAVPPSNASMWRDEWPQFRTSEGVLTLSAGVATGAMLLLGPVDDARWQGGILFDNAVREELRARSASTNQTFRSIGDYTYMLSPVLPLIDIVVVAAIARSDKKLAINLGMMALEAYSYTGFTYFASTEIFARARPDSNCNTPGGTCDTQSFYGGHAAISATGAGLMCANHTRLALWGHPVADAAACVLAASNALLTGTTRIVADRHYASDVIVGTSLGFGFGYAIPVLLHYSYGKADRIAISPIPACGPNCIGVRGTF